MIKFLYKYGIVSILSFIFSNLLFYFFQKLFNPSIASFLTIVVVFCINTQLFFKTKLFERNKSNYYKLLTISISFRIFECILFNILYIFILTNMKTNYIFLITLIFSFLIKTIVYYKSSVKKKLLDFDK